MNRRAFFRVLGIGAASIVAAPYLPYIPTPAPRYIIHEISTRKMMTRIRITDEVMAGIQPGAFLAACRLETAQMIHDLKNREWVVTGYWH